jgi:hypothetical protein
MEGFLFLTLFSFLSLRIWQFLQFFFCHILGFRFSIKDVLLWCLMGVSVDKKIIQISFFLINIYDFFAHGP